MKNIRECSGKRGVLINDLVWITDLAESLVERISPPVRVRASWAYTESLKL